MKISKIRNIILVGFSFAFLNGCISGGTHGYISAYDFNVSKYTLEKAVDQVIKDNSNIKRSTIKDHFNDDTGYVTIQISRGTTTDEYVFRYYADKSYWDTSKSSEIFIAYANAGSEGGGITKQKKKYLKALIAPFREELINKIDSILGTKCVEDDNF